MPNTICNSSYYRHYTVPCDNDCCLPDLYYHPALFGPFQLVCSQTFVLITSSLSFSPCSSPCISHVDFVPPLFDCPTAPLAYIRSARFLPLSSSISLSSLCSSKEGSPLVFSGYSCRYRRLSVLLKLFHSQLPCLIRSASPQHFQGLSFPDIHGPHVVFKYSRRVLLPCRLSAPILLSSPVRSRIGFQHSCRSLPRSSCLVTILLLPSLPGFTPYLSPDTVTYLDLSPAFTSHLLRTISSHALLPSRTCALPVISAGPTVCNSFSALFPSGRLSSILSSVPIRMSLKGSFLDIFADLVVCQYFTVPLHSHLACLL